MKLRPPAAALLPLLLAVSLIATAAADERWQPVSGPALRSLLAGKEFGDGTHYAYRFLADGTFKGTEMGRDVLGRWRAEGAELCTRRSKPRPVDECFELEHVGQHLRMLQGGQVVQDGHLSPAPSQSLKSSR